MPGVRLFLCGDVMLGRGIDQILPHPGDPTLYQKSTSSALHYVQLAERRSGPIARPVPCDYVWGEALDALAAAKPDLRIVNLETSITTCAPVQPKDIHYRMAPRNVGCLLAAGIDCCVVANNHVLDCGPAGLLETLDTLDRAGVAHAGAGGNARDAAAPAVMELSPGGRVLVYSFAMRSSGAPRSWQAGPTTPGVNFLTTITRDKIQPMLRMAHDMRRAKRPGDIVIASIHWGPNFGYEVADGHRKLAHFLIAVAGVDLIHGHSAHHTKAIEVYRSRLILYGCGDFITDYEGTVRHEPFRDDLSVMYLPMLTTDGALGDLRMIPFRSKRLRLEHADAGDAAWLARTLDSESARYGTRVRLNDDMSLSLAGDG